MLHRTRLWFFSLACVLLLVSSAAGALSIRGDDKVDAKECDARYYKHYYLTNGGSEVFVGTYRQEPVLHTFDTVCLLECGNRSNELYQVSTTESGKIELKDLMPRVYEQNPGSRGFSLVVQEVKQTQDGSMAIHFYSPTEEKEIVVTLDQLLK